VWLRVNLRSSDLCVCVCGLRCVASATRVDADQQRKRRFMRKLLVALAIVAVSGIAAPAQVTNAATIGGCSSLLALGSGGKACVWTGGSYTSTKYSTGNMTQNGDACVKGCSGAWIRSYGNRISNRRAAIYSNDVTVLVDLCSNCGNSNASQYFALFFRVYG
jgi:hypothetical protein